MLMTEEWGACLHDEVVGSVACGWWQSQCTDWVEVAGREGTENCPQDLCTLAALMVEEAEEESPD
jgi:hypothetical protein